MKGANLRRLVTFSLVAALATLAGFKLVFYLRVQHELNRHPEDEATPPENIHVLPGFKVELLHSATATEGSWISMTMDPQGRLIVSPQGPGKLLRLTVAGGRLTKTERLDLPCSAAMGLLYASNSLFLDCEGPAGRGIYRAPDQGGTFGTAELLRLMNFSNFEHGPHAIVLGPDGKLYVVAGDFTESPPDVLPASPFRHYADDQLLPRAEDSRGLGVGLQPPGGFVLRMDLDGQNCELFDAGSRNIYSIAFNADGELFGADNDMEWEAGMAWYRPVHISHLVSGGEYGHRQGTGKAPYYDEDTLPSTRDLGLGAPTGVKFPPVQGSFPAAYRDACFVEDWAYGRLFAVHLTPQGASYQATVETVLRGQPLNLTGLEFAGDGSLYFITGGRGTESGLYRLIHTGAAVPDNPKTPRQIAQEDGARAARKLRHQLEVFQCQRDPRACDVIWPNLSSPDRWIRFAARVALENQDVSWWRDRALFETNVEGGLTALLALARCGGRETQPGLLQALHKFPFSGLSQPLALLKLRVLELSFIRQGRPSSDLAESATRTLDPLYPSANEDMNHELCQILLYLQAPDAVAKTVALLEKAPTQEEQTYYVMRLRDITNGWTMDLRRGYLGWFQKKRDHAAHRPELAQYFRDVGLTYNDGISVIPYLENFLDENVATLSAAERQELALYLPKPPPADATPSGRQFVKHWRMADLEPDLGMLQWRRSRARGRNIFREATCQLCHRFDGLGGLVGPDLTAVGSRMAGRDILESILEPSKVLPEQYQNTLLTLRDGNVLEGRVVEENERRLVLMTDLIARSRVEILKPDVKSRRLSRISPMPEGLLDALTETEIWDLIAYLESAGKPASAAPQKN
jgi:putative heme-binding domain-containing protein